MATCMRCRRDIGAIEEAILAKTDIQRTIDVDPQTVDMLRTLTRLVYHEGCQTLLSVLREMDERHGPEAVARLKLWGKGKGGTGRR